MCVAQNAPAPAAARPVPSAPVQQELAFSPQPAVIAGHPLRMPLLATFRWLPGLRRAARARLRRDGLGAAFAYLAAATHGCPDSTVNGKQRAATRSEAKSTWQSD